MKKIGSERQAPPQRSHGRYHRSIVEYRGVRNAGIFTANGEKNKSEEKRQELYAFGRNLI